MSGAAVIRTDHLAGAAFVAFGAAVIALSGELPMGDLAFPGSGFLPKLVAAAMMLLGGALILGARSSPPLATVDWSDAKHAALVLLVTAAAVWLYTRLGFTLTMLGLLVALLLAVERKPPLRAALYGMAVVAVAYGVFAYVLRTPLPRGLLGL